MRADLLAAAAMLALAPTAHAQGLDSDKLRPLYGIGAVETSPMQRLHPDARAWIDQERTRQSEEPGDLIALAVDIDSHVGEAIRKLAKRERVGNGDLLLVVMYDIVAGARDDVDARLTQVQARGASDIEIQTLATRKAELDAKLAEVIAEQTTVSRSLVPQLAWSEK